MTEPTADSAQAGPRGLAALPAALDTAEEADGLIASAGGLHPDAFAAPDGQDLAEEPADWAWVEEWRAGGEPVPWGPGLALSGFTAALVASAVYVLSAGLSDRPIVAIGVNILVAGGLGPALWLSRSLPVLRWIAGGAVAGVLLAWLSVLIFLA